MEASKKHFFKKEKKELRLKRHKAPTGKSKKVSPKLQFPKISRFIPDGFGKLPIKSTDKLRINLKPRKINSNVLMRRSFWMGIRLVIAFVGIGLLSRQLFAQWKALQDAKQNYAKLQQNLKTWENIAQRYPTYRDAYFEAAILAYRLGDREKEAVYIDKILMIDPNFQPAIDLRKK